MLRTACCISFARANLCIFMSLASRGSAESDLAAKLVSVGSARVWLLPRPRTAFRPSADGGTSLKASPPLMNAPSSFSSSLRFSSAASRTFTIGFCLAWKLRSSTTHSSRNQLLASSRWRPASTPFSFMCYMPISIGWYKDAVLGLLDVQRVVLAERLVNHVQDLGQNERPVLD